MSQRTNHMSQRNNRNNLLSANLDSSIICDTRNTSLFKNSENLKGKRYKFQIEDMVKEKLTVSNFNQFREKRSYHYMNERNTGHNL
jgi:hypothetical protein